MTALGTLVWIVPPLVLIAGAVGCARVLADIGRRSDDLRLAVAACSDVRSSTGDVRAAVEDTRRPFEKLGRR